MTRDEYLEFHRECCDRMIAITMAKNADYTSGSNDPFYNFSRVEALGIASTEQGFLTRMYDKFARITTFVKVGVLAVKDESVTDTLLDLANYCVLMAGYIKAKRLAKEQEDRDFCGVDHMEVRRAAKDSEQRRAQQREAHAMCVAKGDANGKA